MWRTPMPYNQREGAWWLQFYQRYALRQGQQNGLRLLGENRWDRFIYIIMDSQNLVSLQVLYFEIIRRILIIGDIL